MEVPRVISIYAKCVEHHIQDTLIQRLHFNDLWFLIMTLEIANLKQIIDQQKKLHNKNSTTNKNNVRDISQEEAIRFLKGS